MATHTRKSAWNNGGTFKNQDLLWYAKGAGVMQSRALKDQKSWWFFGAIHGQEISLPQFPGWGHLPSPPQVAHHSATNADRQKTVLGSVSAPDLVFPSMAPWLSDRSGGANPRGRAESRWSEDLGLALLELLWPSQSI